jgi:hypothetical protein
LTHFVYDGKESSFAETKISGQAQLFYFLQRSQELFLVMVVTLRSVIAKRPKVVSQFMRMMAESNKLLITDRELTCKVMAKKLRLNDRMVFDAAYNGELKVLEPRLEIRPEAIQATLQEIAKTDPRATKVSAQQLIDRRFLEEMERDGTFERLALR